MSREQDQLDELQKMLALKRHEQPPTRFFHKLSDNVLQRLQTPEPPCEPTWRQRLGLDFDSKPVLVCATGVGVCGLLLLGLIASQHVAPPDEDSLSSSSATQLSLVPPPRSYPTALNPSQLAPVENRDGQRRSVDPVIAGQGTTLKPLTTPASDGKESIPEVKPPR
jgi:hypothetical protein